LTKNAAPVVNGLKLGMTKEQVLAVFPGSETDPDLQSQLSRPPSRFGVSDFVIRPEKLEPKDKFASFTHFTFGLLDGHVSSLNIGYAGPAYSNVDEFVSQFVAGTNLPQADQWQAYPGMENQLKVLTCKDFEIKIFAGGTDGNLNYVLLTDLEADKKVKDRRAKARAQASQTPAATPMPSP
jgi:hypothetical protein